MLSSLTNLINPLKSYDDDNNLEIDIIELIFDHGPLLMTLSQNINKTKIIVHSFEKTNTGEPGPVELTGKVKIGDYLLAINAKSVPGSDFERTIELLKSAYWPLTLRFGCVFLRDKITKNRIENEYTYASIPCPPNLGRNVIARRRNIYAQIHQMNKLIIGQAFQLDTVLRKADRKTKTLTNGYLELEKEIKLLPYLRESLLTIRKQMDIVCHRTSKLEKKLNQVLKLLPQPSLKLSNNNYNNRRNYEIKDNNNNDEQEI